MHPLCSLVAMLVIFSFVQAVTAIDGSRLHLLAYICMSCLIFAGSLGSLFIHEYAHVLTARRVGVPVHEVTLSLLGAYTLIRTETVEPHKTLIIACAGPAANIITGITLFAVSCAFPQSAVFSPVCFALVAFNGLLSVYNLIPVMPLDGGMIVRSLLWVLSGDWLWSTRRALVIGNGFAVLCMLAGIMLIFTRQSVLSVLIFLLGVSLWKREKSVLQQVLTADILHIVTMSECRKEVMGDAIR